MHAFLQEAATLARPGGPFCSYTTAHTLSSFADFPQVQNNLQLEAVTNLVSVGDSHIEMDAVRFHSTMPLNLFL